MGGPLDIGRIRLAVPGERGGDADDYDVDVTKPGKIARRPEHPVGIVAGDLLAGDCRDIRAARLEIRDLRRVDVEAPSRESGARRGCCERQSHIAEPDDADARLLAGDAGLDKVGMIYGVQVILTGLEGGSGPASRSLSSCRI